MGYRNETEHLRHRVQQLEGELNALKDARSPRTDSGHVASGKRQGILLIALACLCSVSGAVCVIPTTVAAIGEEDVPPLSDVTYSHSYAMHRFRGTIDRAHVFPSPGYYGNEAAPLREEPRIIIRCGWDCDPAIRDELGGVTHRPGEVRVFYGEVSEPGDYAFSDVGIERLEEHAARNGLELSELRVVSLYPREESPLPPMLAMLGMLVVASLGFWFAWFWHRRAMKREAPMPIASDYALQDAGLTVFLTIITCRLYELYWIYRSTAQVRRLTGRRDLIPLLDVMLALLTFGLWGFWVHWRNVDAVDEALSTRGPHLKQSGNVVGLTLGSFVCGVLHWVLIYKVQEAYNLLTVDKMTSDDF